MVKRIIISAFLLFGVLSAKAQVFPAERWYPGEIRLNDDTYLQGQLKYDLEHDAVQLDRDGRIETYSPKQVTSFTFKVEQIKRTARGSKKKEVGNRFFFSLPFTNDVGYRQQRFFEVVVEGKATLLAREYITVVSNNNNQHFRRRNLRRIGDINDFQTLPNTRRVLRHKMFLASLDGQIRELPQKRRDFLYLFKDHEATLKDFIKEERLKLDILYDVARIFTHYNSQGIQQSKAH